MNNIIKELELKINTARKDYYNGVSKVSDKLYDAWIDELTLIDPKNLVVIGIGAEPVSNWEKYFHKEILGSLNKVQTENEYKSWHNKYISSTDEVFLTLKLDGLSVSLIYENGVLVKAASRGSGVCGELLTPNVAKMQGIPLRLNKKVNATIRGEILISKDNFEKHFKEYSNARNAASGVSRRYDGENSDKLSVVVYHLHSDDFTPTTYKEQFNILEELGFNVPTYYVVKTYDEVNKLKSQYQETLRDQYTYMLDGLVAHQNNLAKLEAFGSHNARSYASIAVKFDSVAKEATISDIIIQCGNSGRLTPVAIFSPKVDLMGAMVEKASLHNFANINELGIDIGCKVLVCRSNDVIPYVEEVSESTGTIFQPPTNCPSCGGEVLKTGEYLQCTNTTLCAAQLNGRIINWIKELNVLEIGPALIERLVESGKVTTVADLYKLSVEDLMSMDRMGKKSAQKCYDLLWKNTCLPLDIFVGALSINGVGSTIIRQIMSAGYDTLDKLLVASLNQLESVPNMGPVRAESLFNGLKHYKPVIDQLLANGVTIKERTMGKLTGISVNFTGAMINKRAVLEAMVIAEGGEIKTGKNLSILVIADVNSTSSKANMARKAGTKIISEEDFLEMVK